MATVYLGIQRSLGRPGRDQGARDRSHALAKSSSSASSTRRARSRGSIIRTSSTSSTSAARRAARSTTRCRTCRTAISPAGICATIRLRILDVIRAIADALGYAHEQGIVHRDVKPENVLFDKLDRPLLADFGIALSDTHQPRVTREGATIGSSGYMSPEQARSQPLDGRSDIYSLGVALLRASHRRDAVPRARHAVGRARAHRECRCRACRRCAASGSRSSTKSLAKRPEARFQSAEEVLAGAGCDRAAHHGAAACTDPRAGGAKLAERRPRFRAARARSRSGCCITSRSRACRVAAACARPAGGAAIVDRRTASAAGCDDIERRCGDSATGRERGATVAPAETPRDRSAGRRRRCRSTRCSPKRRTSTAHGQLVRRERQERRRSLSRRAPRRSVAARRDHGIEGLFAPLGSSTAAAIEHGDVEQRAAESIDHAVDARRRGEAAKKTKAFDGVSRSGARCDRASSPERPRSVRCGRTRAAGPARARARQARQPRAERSCRAISIGPPNCCATAATSATRAGPELSVIPARTELRRPSRLCRSRSASTT